MTSSPPIVEIHPGSARQVGRRTSLLPVPLASIAAAVVTHRITVVIDRAWAERSYRPAWSPPDLGADDARSVVSTVTGASITVLALLLSITMVTLSMAATQFGPRLTGEFLKSSVAKATIAAYTALFVFSLLVLSTVNTGSDEPFVPVLGTGITVVGAVVSVGLLVAYTNAVAQSVRLPRLVEVVAADLQRVVQAVSTSPLAKRVTELSTDDRTALAAAVDADHAAIVAGRSGYVQQIELQPLLDAATAGRGVVWCDVRPGDFVMAGARLARVHPASAAGTLAPACERHIDLGAFRTIDQDVEFAVDQLVEIAIRALSPAINDTFTAITCIDWLGTAIRFLATHNRDRPTLRDDAGSPRVVTRPRPFPGLVDAAFDLIRQAGADNPAVAIHLIDTIRMIVDFVPDDVDEELLVQAHMVVLAAAVDGFVPRDRDELIDRYAALCGRAGVPARRTRA